MQAIRRTEIHSLFYLHKQIHEKHLLKKIGSAEFKKIFFFPLESQKPQVNKIFSPRAFSP